jgi:maltooligosyltrehalose trehalohydrolase
MADDDGTEAPDPQDVGTFLRSKLDWSELDKQPHRSLLAWHKELIALRRREPDLSSGGRKLVTTSFDEDRRWLVVRRGHFSVAANFADEGQGVPLGACGSVVLASDIGVKLGPGPAPAPVLAQAWLPPRSVAVVAH